MEHITSWGATFIAYSLISRGNLLVALDPLRSSSMVRFDASTSKLIDVAKEYSSYGVFAAAFLGDSASSAKKENAKEEENHAIIVADLDLNLFTALKTKAGISEGSGTAPNRGNESETLTMQAVIHVGEVVNKFASGRGFFLTLNRYSELMKSI